MVHGIEELPNVELQRPAVPRSVLAGRSDERLKTPNRRVRAFPDSAGITIEDEGPLDGRLQHPHHGVVNQSVAHGRFMDNARPWIEQMKAVIWSVAIGSVLEFRLQPEHLILQMSLKRLDVTLSALPAAEFPPCGKEIFLTRYLFKYVFHS